MVGMLARCRWVLDAPLALQDLPVAGAPSTLPELSHRAGVRFH